MNDTPRFAVVGHPNKGKSSIVATLSSDTSVAIAPLSGTTTQCREYPLRVDGELLYVLIDTPGFQRARKALAWMQAHAGDAAGRPDVVRSFVAQFAGRGEFPDECELLRPVIDGAGIIYVTDGSRPYGREYEAEMEILRWSGQPSMALINRIGPSDHVGEWRDALGQYFAIVREFNAFDADFDRRINILRAFAQLHDSWRASLDRAADILREARASERRLVARELADALVEMLTLTESRAVPRDAGETEAARISAALRAALLDSLRQREQRCRRAVEEILRYTGIERSETGLAAEELDLFAGRGWEIWGLERRQLVATAAAGGAAAGLGVDIAVGGASLLTGALLGSVIGGVGAWLGFDRLADVRVLGQPIGGETLRAGPITNPNFPFVVLGRAVSHYQALRARTHARREPLDLDALRAQAAKTFDDAAVRRRLGGTFATLARRGSVNAETHQALIDAIETLLETAEAAA